MKKKTKFEVAVIMFLAGLVSTPCLVGASQASLEVTKGQSTSAEKPKTICKGKINGVSKKAKSIMITVGKGKKAKVVMLKFDEKTKGIEHAKKGEAAVIIYEIIGQDKIARTIKPKLAKLPAGVAEMQPEDLVALVNMAETEKEKYLLIDSRPASRFAKGHIPTSISLPVSKFKELASAVLPQDKGSLLIFHCGGPT